MKKVRFKSDKEYIPLYFNDKNYKWKTVRDEPYRKSSIKYKKNFIPCLSCCNII